VADPEGANTAKTLKLLGFDDIKAVKSAKTFKLFLDVDSEEKARARAKDACDQLLANPVIQDYELKVKEA